MNKSKLIVLIKWALLIVLLFLSLQLVTLSILMAFQVSRTPSYDGGEAFVNYSPDGKYRGAVVYIAEQHQTGWVKSGMSWTNASPHRVYLLTDPSGKEVYAIIPMHKHWVSSGGTASWYCGSTGEEACTHVYRGYNFEVALPPSSWKRLHAWLTVRLKNLQDAEFSDVVLQRTHVTKRL